MKSAATSMDRVTRMERIEKNSNSYGFLIAFNVSIQLVLSVRVLFRINAVSSHVLYSPFRLYRIYKSLRI